MPDETSKPKPTEKKRALTVRDLKPKGDPKGGTASGGSGFRLDVVLVALAAMYLPNL